MMTKTKDDRLLPMSKITNIFHGENVDDANNARILFHRKKNRLFSSLPLLPLSTALVTVGRR